MGLRSTAARDKDKDKDRQIDELATRLPVRIGKALINRGSSQQPVGNSDTPLEDGGFSTTAMNERFGMTQYHGSAQRKWHTKPKAYVLDLNRSNPQLHKRRSTGRNGLKILAVIKCAITWIIFCGQTHTISWCCVCRPAAAGPQTPEGNRESWMFKIPLNY